jgi:tellurite resistance protein TerC
VLPTLPSGAAQAAAMSVPAWAWAVFGGFVLTVLALDLFVLHRRAHEVSLKEAGIWSAVWVAAGLGFAGLLWAWQGSGTAQAYLAGYLIEKSLSLDNVFVFAVIFSAFAIPLRYQHRVLMAGIIGALIMRAAFILAGVALLETFHSASYVFGAVLVWAAVNMLRGSHPRPERNRALRALRRLLPVTEQLHSQRFFVRYDGRVLVTPLMLALIVVEATDVIFAIDSIPAILAITTDTFVVYTSNVFALLGMRALYFLLAGAAARFRYLQPGLAVILAAVAVKLLVADIYTFPAWASPAFIAAVLAAVTVLSVHDSRAAARPPVPLVRAGRSFVRPVLVTALYLDLAHRPGSRPAAAEHGIPPARTGWCLAQGQHDERTPEADTTVRRAACCTRCWPASTPWWG